MLGFMSGIAAYGGAVSAIHQIYAGFIMLVCVGGLILIAIGYGIESVRGTLTLTRVALLDRLQPPPPPPA